MGILDLLTHLSSGLFVMVIPQFMTETKGDQIFATRTSKIENIMSVEFVLFHF